MLHVLFTDNMFEDCNPEALQVMAYTMRRCNEFFDHLNSHGVFLPARVAVQAMKALDDVCVSWMGCGYIEFVLSQALCVP